MWDIIVPLILMVVFYLVPEILKKRRRPEEYKYPEIPDKVPPPMPDRVPPPVETRPRPEIKPLPPPTPPPRMPAPADVLPPPAPQHQPPLPHMKPVEPTYVPHLKPVQPTFTVHLPPAVAVPAMVEASPWEGKLDSAVVLNAVIFAEILQPPRSRRPLKPWHR